MRLRKTMTASLALCTILAACSSSESTFDTVSSQRDTGFDERPVDTTPVFPDEQPSSPYPDVQFDDPGVNRPEDALEDRLSTFALDVDTASYTIGRRYLNDGFLPDPDSVRVEEYVNFFAQDYPVPTDGFSISVDGGPTPFVSEDTVVVRVGLRAADLESRPPTNLVFVIDTSGSMDSGSRLDIVKRSLELLVGELTAEDTVTMVEFGDRASLVLAPTFGDEKRTITDAIAQLTPGGSTNFEAGLRLGYDAADRLHRDGVVTKVVVASDGVANVGLEDPESLVGMIRRDADNGVTLVTIGVGMGNYNDTLLEQLANDGDGFYAYVDTREQAEDLFVNDLTGTLITIAKDARVQVEFDPESVRDWRLVGYENRAIADDSFRDDTIDAGEVGAGHTVTALYELRLTRSAMDDGANRLGRVSVRWLEPETSHPNETSLSFTMDDLARSYRSTGARFQQDVVVAQYAEVLRGSRYSGAWSIDKLVAHAQDVADQLRGDTDVADFADLVDMAARLER